MHFGTLLLEEGRVPRHCGPTIGWVLAKRWFAKGSFQRCGGKLSHFVFNRRCRWRKKLRVPMGFAIESFRRHERFCVESFGAWLVSRESRGCRWIACRGAWEWASDGSRIVRDRSACRIGWSSVGYGPIDRHHREPSHRRHFRDALIAIAPESGRGGRRSGAGWWSTG